MPALWTGQRQGDLLALPWSAYDGSHVAAIQDWSFRDGSGWGTLKALLDKTPKRSPCVLTNKSGVPWTSDGFRASWRKLCAKAKIQDLTFHDLRGSAVTRLALAGPPTGDRWRDRTQPVGHRSLISIISATARRSPRMLSDGWNRGKSEQNCKMRCKTVPVNKGLSNGGRTRTRTLDPLIKSQLLYQLSYAP